MISRFVYNNSKKETVILIHGLYANSGFWLNYIIFFKNYRLIIYNIDYNILLNNNYGISVLNLKPYLNDYEENVVAVVAHSLGTVLADLVFGKRNLPLFNICPIASGNRIDTIGFVNYISNKLALPSFMIHDTLINVDTFIYSVKNKLSYGGINIVPTSDLYFTYNLNLANRILFNGDHFNIEEAISNVILDESNKLKF
jgi:hypothetical protein